jgi:hypothetical protein
MPEKTMLALVKTAKGKGHLELRDVPVPQVGAGDVLIEIKAAGICGTDLHIYHDEYPYWPPVILGHEFAGVIAETGREVADWKAGDRVVGEPHTLACGTCWLCREIAILSLKRSPGWGIDGCFARYMRFPTLAFIASRMTSILKAPPSLNHRQRRHDVLERCCVEPGRRGGGGAGPDRSSRPWRKASERQSHRSRRPPMRTCAADGAPHPGHRPCLERPAEDVVRLLLDLTAGRGADIVVEQRRGGRHRPRPQLARRWDDSRPSA